MYDNHHACRPLAVDFVSCTRQIMHHVNLTLRLIGQEAVHYELPGTFTDDGLLRGLRGETVFPVSLDHFLTVVRTCHEAQATPLITPMTLERPQNSTRLVRRSGVRRST